MKSNIHTFAAHFPPADYTAWRELAQKAIKDADFDTALVSKTEDGVVRGPLFTAKQRKSEAALARAKDPHLAERPWHISTLVDFAEIGAANRDALEDLKGGASALLIKIGAPGQPGVAVQNKFDVMRLLAGVHTDLAPIALMPSPANFKAAAVFAAHLETETSLRNTFLSVGYAPVKIGGDTRDDITALSKWVLRNAPHWRALSVDARSAHEAGASPAQELAYMLAVGAAYMGTLLKAGIAFKDAAGLVDIYLAADQDTHQNIIKMRAARILWAKMMEEFGASGEDTNGYFHMVSSARMMSRLDPWSNMLRLSAAGFGAACGGADRITLLPFTQAIPGFATPFARRISRNLQLLLMEECHLGQVSDPAHGSFMHEAQSANLARTAWDMFRHIEKLGGWGPGQGWLKDVIAKTHGERLRKIAAGETKLVGVNQFANLDVRKAETRRSPRILAKEEKAIIAKTFAEALSQAREGFVLPVSKKPPAFPPVSLTEAAETALEGDA